MGTLFFCIEFVKYTPDDWSLFQSGRVREVWGQGKKRPPGVFRTAFLNECVG